MTQDEKSRADKIQALKEKHGEIYALSIEVDDETIHCIVRKPARPEFSRFAREATADVFRAMNNLFFDCLVEPDAQVMRERFERDPGLVITLGNKLLTIAKLNLEVIEKKL